MAITREAFEAALKVGIAEAMAQNPGLAPIIHLSAHGNAEGVGLSSGEHITWNHLRDLLQPINKALSGALVVCLSCCEGYAGIRMAMHHDSDPPYFALIGNTTSPTWSETAIAYATLIHASIVDQPSHNFYVALRDFVSSRVAHWRCRVTDPTVVVHCDPDILGGTPVFVGTRVPFQNLIDYLAGGDSLDGFLHQFPSVTRAQTRAALGLAREALEALVAV